MNYYISILFRTISLFMGIICFTYGFYINTLGDRLGSGGDRLGSGYIVASHVIIFFTAICIALFTTVATIIRQLINKYNSVYKVVLPAIGYICAFVAIIGGLYFAFKYRSVSPYFVSGI